MKKTLILFVLFISISNAPAQQKVDSYYYAIDGSKSRNKAKRDIVEELLVNEIELNLLKMKAQGYFPENIHENVVEHFNNTVHSIYNLIKVLRENNEEIEPMISLSKNIFIREGIDIKSGYAKNGEWFVLDEYRAYFDSTLETFNYLYNLTKSMANLKTNNPNYSNVAEHIFTRLKRVEANNNLHVKNISAKMSAIDRVVNSLIENDMNKDNKDPYYYSFDGSKFEEEDDRDAHEEAIMRILNWGIDRLDERLISKKTKKHLVIISSLISDNSKVMRLTNNNFKNLTFTTSKTNINPTGKEYKAINNEVFCTIDIRDNFNHTIGLYKILDSYVTALRQKNATKNIDIDDFRDSFGYTAAPLIQMIGEKNIKLKKQSRELIDEKW